MGRAGARGERVLWADLLSSSDYQGLWVALESVRYDSASRQPLDGILIDADEDLAALCTRIQSRERQGCSIHFCDDGGSGIRRATI